MRSHTVDRIQNDTDASRRLSKLRHMVHVPPVLFVRCLVPTVGRSPLVWLVLGTMFAPPFENTRADRNQDQDGDSQP